MYVRMNDYYHKNLSENYYFLRTLVNKYVVIHFSAKDETINYRLFDMFEKHANMFLLTPCVYV